MVAGEWNWLLWSRMNTISSSKPSRTAVMVLHSVLSRCLVSLPEDCNFKMGNHVDQFFRIYQLKPLMRKQPSQNIQSSPDRLSLSLPPSEKKALPSHIEKLMAKPPPKPTACGQCTKCRKHKGCRKVARWNAKYARDTPEESLSSLRLFF